MKAQSLWHGAILSSSLVGIFLAGALVFKSFNTKSRPRLHAQQVKLDPSKVSQIKIIKPNWRKAARDVSTKRGRRVASASSNATINELFSPFGPLKGLSARERFHFKKQVIGYVDSKIRRGSIEPRHRNRFIEMQVLDKSLEMLENSAIQ
jgi:hypothetical protein